MPEIELKDGSHVDDARLGRIPFFDERSRSYNVRELLPAAPKLRQRRWTGGPTLNQGVEGSCVGHAWAKELLLRPVASRGIDDAFARKIYCLAQKRDYWPGTSRICEDAEKPY